jgi:GDPmannose 4,6-dehydratase
VARISAGAQKTLFLGNLNASRDWGHARDYVEGMWAMLQQDTPDDYVLATGETHTVREFVELAFLRAGILIKWYGTGVDEVGVNFYTDLEVVRVDPAYYRPTEVNLLKGDASKASARLGWSPKTRFHDLVAEMVDYDNGEFRKNRLP